MSLQQAILGLLSYRPMSGYDLKQVFDESINNFWSAQLSQIYRDLGTLETKGYVSFQVEPQAGRPDKKVYSVTGEGEEAFQSWLTKFPESLVGPIRDEFNIRIFFGSRLSDQELVFQMERFTRQVRKLLESYKLVNKIIGEYAKEISRPEEKFYWQLTLKRGIMMAETSISWAEECIKELKEKFQKEGEVDG